MISVGMIGWVWNEEVARFMMDTRLLSTCCYHLTNHPGSWWLSNNGGVILPIIYRPYYKVWLISPELSWAPGFPIMRWLPHVCLILLWPGGQAGRVLPRAGRSPGRQADTPSLLCPRLGMGVLAFLPPVGLSKSHGLAHNQWAGKYTWPLSEGFLSPMKKGMGTGRGEKLGPIMTYTTFSVWLLRRAQTC